MQVRPRRTSIATIALLLCLGLPPATSSATAEARAASAASAQIRIDNFGQIGPTYYRGAQPKEDDYAHLAALGIKTLVDLTGDDATPEEKALSAKAGLGYVHIPMTTREAPTTAQLVQFLETVNDPRSQPVYVHCVGGRHRTGVMTAVYRMTHDGWTADRAFKEMKQYKFGADFLHAEFKQFVFGFRPQAFAAALPAVADSPSKAGG